jgi:putative SOS response-associated peptidase YedK
VSREASEEKKCYILDMCGRFTITTNQEIIEARFHAQAVGRIGRHYNAYPNHDQYKLPVITTEDPAHIALRYWGLLPVWWTRDKRGLINVKHETLRDKRTFRKDLAKHRCLVLADGFYEWKGERGRKTPFYIRLKGGEPFAFAGLYEENKRDGRTIGTFAIVTTAPNTLMASIHDRMPFILSQEDEQAWVNPESSPEQALEMLNRPLTADAMEAYAVSTRVNNPAYDQADLLRPVME